MHTRKGASQTACFIFVMIYAQCHDICDMRSVVIHRRSTAKYGRNSLCIAERRERQGGKRLSHLLSALRVAAALISLSCGSCLLHLADGATAEIEIALGVNELAPVNISALKSADNHLGGCDIRSYGNVVDITEAQKVKRYFVRRRLDRGVAEKDNNIYLVI